MNRKHLFIFLGLEIFAIIWAGAVFKIFESRLVAGAFAGTYFLGMGLAMTHIMFWHWPTPFRSFTFYPAMVHTFLISLPMIVVRFSSWALSFEDVRIWGLPGPVFHRLSTTVFSILLLATIVDLARTYWRKPALKN